MYAFGTPIQPFSPCSNESAPRALLFSAPHLETLVGTAYLQLQSREAHKIDERHAAIIILVPLSHIQALGLIAPASFTGETFPVLLDGIIEACFIAAAEYLSLDLTRVSNRWTWNRYHVF